MVISASGVWIDDPEYGRQLRAASLEACLPTTVDGILHYLASGIIPGVGRKGAKALVAAFGDRTLYVLEFESERLATIPGFGEAKRKSVAGAFAGDRAVQEIQLFLASHGLPPNKRRAARIVGKYGADAVKVISDDPYQLTKDIDGVGFRTADVLALGLGIAAGGVVRARAVVAHVLDEATKRGHCALPQSELFSKAVQLVPEIGAQMAGVMDELVLGGDVVREPRGDTHMVYPKMLWDAEQSVASRMAALDSAEAVVWQGNLEADIDEVAVSAGRVYTPAQRSAIVAAATCRVTSITGGPGVGETAVVDGIVRLLKKGSRRYRLAAPTGRAAKRMAVMTGDTATTIHRLLGFHGDGWDFGPGRTLDLDTLILDEVSMIDLPLFRRVLDALPDGASLVCVGDADQLPSIGPGSILADILRARVGAVVRLTEIMRQAAGSRIVVSAHAINSGRLPDLSSPQGENSDFYWLNAADSKVGDMIVDLVSRRLPAKYGFHPVRDIQVLAPMHDGPLGITALNCLLQQALNPGAGGASLQRKGGTFRAGDKVIQLRNDYDRKVFNGDVGIIETVNLLEAVADIRFEGGPLSYPLADFDSLQLAYAYSIHRAQGSEYPVLVLPVVPAYGFFFQRSLLYTALTRAKKLAVLVEDRGALARAIENNHAARRWTGLEDKLRRAALSSDEIPG